MGRSILVSLCILCLTFSAQAQFKSQTERTPVDVKGAITTPTTLFGLFSPDRFYMTQSYGVSFYTGGGQSSSLGLYTNSMNFKLSDPLMLRVNMGVSHQPFAGKENQNAQFLHGAELIYKPSRYFQMNVGYSNSPYYSGLGYGNYFSPGFQSSDNGFDQYKFGEKK